MKCSSGAGRWAWGTGALRKPRCLALLGLTGRYATGIYLLVFGRSAFGHLHGPFAFLTTALIVAHIFMAVVNPSTRHALRGMTLGTVNRDWAEHHFPRWVAETDLDESRAQGSPAPAEPARTPPSPTAVPEPFTVSRLGDVGAELALHAGFTWAE